MNGFCVDFSVGLQKNVITFIYVKTRYVVGLLLLVLGSKLIKLILSRWNLDCVVSLSVVFVV